MSLQNALGEVGKRKGEVLCIERGVLIFGQKKKDPGRKEKEELPFSQKKPARECSKAKGFWEKKGYASILHSGKRESAREQDYRKKSLSKTQAHSIQSTLKGEVLHGKGGD